MFTFVCWQATKRADQTVPILEKRKIYNSNNNGGHLCRFFDSTHFYQVLYAVTNLISSYHS